RISIVAFQGLVTAARAFDAHPPKDSEWRHLPASADPGHQLERRHGAAVEPAAQEPGPEGAVTTAAGDREKMCRRQSVVRARCGPFAIQRLLPFTDQRRPLQVI